MKTIEVFVESGCRACVAVVGLLRVFVQMKSIELRIYYRTIDAREFRERHIAITPATLVDRRLVFYGEFTADQLQKYLNGSLLLNPSPMNHSQPLSKGVV